MSFIKFLTGQNPQMKNMIAPAVERLKMRNPEEVCRLSGAEYRDDAVILHSFGKEIRFTLPDYTPDQEVDDWLYLTLLQYLNQADGTPDAKRWISLRELPGGDARGTGFDREIDQMFQTDFSRIHSAEFKEACLRAGGRIVSEKADVCAVFDFAPKFPIRVSFWEKDEEFPASGKMLVDQSAIHYLSMEGCGTACVLTAQRIRRMIHDKQLKR